MSTPYNCELCKKEFKQKIDFTRHTSKKVPCISLSEIQQLEQNKGVTNDIKSQLVTAFKQILNILRDNEGITGEKALRNMCYFVVLKLIEPRLETPINIDNYPYDFSDISDDVVEIHKTKMLQIVRFTNLAKEDDVDIVTNMEYLWDSILSQHPSTKNIFLKGKRFDIKRQTTYKKIIDHLNKITFIDNGFDVLGEAYGEVIKDMMDTTGKVLGQFFTPLSVKDLMIKLINPQIHPDGKIDTIGDPTMGTGGFLISYLKHIKHQADVKQIQPDWNFIKTHGLYGKELEPDTYQLAISNMLISTGHIFENMDNGDSIREPITRKFDNIMANPPFGIKGLKYDDFDFTNTNILKNEYLPIKSDNAVSLFIQAIIYMLNVNGKCAIVLPDGQDLTSKTNKTFVAIREYLMKTCNLKKIVYLPSGIFTYTSIKTCIFYFIKKREGKYVLDTNIKVSEKTKKETGRTYTFHKTHQTTKIKFYEFNESKKETYLLVEVPIEKIANNSYSLNYSEYMKDVTESEELEEGIVMKTLGEVCKFLPKSKRNAKYGNKEGEYPFFKSSIKVDSYVSEHDYNEESLIIGDGGEPNINYGVKFSTSDHCYILQNKNRLLLNLKYSYYYLYHNLNMMKQLYTGVAIKNISKANIEGITIPVPSLERQQEIVNYLDFIYEKCIKTSLSKIAELKQLNEFCLKNQQLYGDNVVKTLGEVCEFKNGYSFKSTDYEKQNETNIGILQIKSIQNGIISENKITEYIKENTKYKLFEIQKGDILIALSGATTGKIGIYNLEQKSYLNQRVGKINAKTCISQKYIYYWYVCCNIDEKILNLAQGTAQPNISTNDISKIKIPVPSLDKQKEIVEYCEYNDTLIKQLEKEIENNKKQAHQFMSSIVKSSKVSEDYDDASLVNTDSIDDAQDTLSIEEEEEEICIE